MLELLRSYAPSIKMQGKVPIAKIMLSGRQKAAHLAILLFHYKCEMRRFE